MEPKKDDQTRSPFAERIMSMTAEEEAAVIAKIKAEHDPEAAQAEWQEAMEQWQKGELVPLEELLRELGIEVGDERKSA